MARYFALLAALVVLAGCSAKPAPKGEEPPAIVAAPPPSVRLEREASPIRESGAIVLARIVGAEHVFLADEDDEAIAEIDPGTNTVVARTSIGARPRDLLVLGDGRLAATLPDAGAVAIFTRDAAGALTETSRIETPAEPIAMALDPADATLWVTTGASHALVGFSTAQAFAVTRQIALGREPRAVLVSGERVLVTHAAEDFVSVVGGDGSVETRGIGDHALCGGVANCGASRFARNAQAIVRFGAHGLVVPAAQSLPVPPHAFTMRLCRSQQERVKDEKPKEGYGFGDADNGPPVTLDLPTLGAETATLWSTGHTPMFGPQCLLPRAAAAAADGALLVACLGSARVVRYRAASTFSFEAEGKPPTEHFSQGITPNVDVTAIAVPAGPTGIAIDANGDALVWSAFARKLSRVGKQSTLVVEIPRRSPREAGWLRGRELFFTNGDARISTDGRACASCHVDGGDDGLTWKTPQGPRRTRTLRGELARGPYGWTGEHATLAEHIRSTVKNLGGAGLPDEAIANLGVYVSSLRSQPPRKDGPDVDRGKALFAASDCNACHPSGASDRRLHDIGTGGAFMTPTLASSGTRHRLMHDGRFENLDDLLAHSPDMGRGSTLTPDDRHALALYLDTL